MHPSIVRRATVQRGAVLAVGLVILLVCSILGLFMMSSSMLDERAAGGNLDRDIAFQSAEMALRDAEWYVVNNFPGPGFDAACTNGLCLPSTNGTNQWDAIDWNGNIPITYGARTGAPALPAVTQQPRFIVEDLHQLQACNGCSQSMQISRTAQTGNPFRITVVGYGKQTGSRVMLQSVFIKQ